VTEDKCFAIQPVDKEVAQDPCVGRKQFNLNNGK